MSHRWDCPTSWEAERQGKRAQERGEGRWRNPYQDDGWGSDRCEDAERHWRSGYDSAERREQDRQDEERRESSREEQRREEARWAEHRREEARQEEEYYRQLEAEQYDQMETEHYAFLESEQRHEIIDLPRFEDEGGYTP